MSGSTKVPEQKYDMRAPPRRRIKGEEPDDQPVFLRKAFTMVSSCPVEIGKHVSSFEWRVGYKFDLFHLSCLLGGWSEKGDTVIIRDVKQFSEKIIPTVYKHNNFSSFVRQLNFCKLA